MIHSLTLAPRLMAEISFPSPTATKVMAELAMALHFFRQSYPMALLDAKALAKAEADLTARLTSDAHLALLANPFLVAQALTPYIFLRDAIAPLPSCEALLAELVREDASLREATPYRRMERGYLLAKLGRTPLPGWRGAAILHDARRAWAFNRDATYAFTHTVLFATDFAAVQRPDPFVKGISLMALAQAHAAADLDLFWELALCLMSQTLAPDELAGLCHLAADLRDRYVSLFRADDLEAAYHPLLVHDILRGRLLARHGIDLWTVAAAADGPFPALLILSRALNGKNAGRIESAHAALPRNAWSDVMVRDRLTQLRRLARREVLFLREIGPDQTPDPSLYPDYTRQISQSLARLAAG